LIERRRQLTAAPERTVLYPGNESFPIAPNVRAMPVMETVPEGDSLAAPHHRVTFLRPAMSGCVRVRS
jgi:hypothetical protein